MDAEPAWDAADDVAEAAAAASDAVAAELRRAHPLARALYDALRDRSREDKILVLQALERRAAPGAMAEKQERAYHALAEFVEEQGRFPAANEWESWRKRAGGPGMRSNLPSAKFIRNAFGDWPSARAAFAAAAPVADVLSRRLTALGSAFENAELLEIVRVWAGMQTGQLARADFEAWLAHPRATATAGIQRAPYSYKPFRRLGDSWPGVLRAAGFDPAARGTQRRGRMAPPSESDLIAVLREWAASCEGALFRDDFKLWWETTSFPDRPGFSDVSRRWRHIRDAFGTWPAFLAAAGLAHRSAAAMKSAERGERPPAYKAPYAPRDCHEQWLDWVRTAAGELGASMSMSEFERWRRARMDQAALLEQPIPSIPHPQSLYRVYGGASAVKRQAGVISDEQAAFERTHHVYRRADLIDAVAQAIIAGGTRIRGNEYKRWRAQERRTHRNNPHFRLPSISILRHKLGGPQGQWPVVIQTVLDERPALRQPTKAALAQAKTTIAQASAPIREQEGDDRTAREDKTPEEGEMAG